MIAQTPTWWQILLLIAAFIAGVIVAVRHR